MTNSEAVLLGTSLGNRLNRDSPIWSVAGLVPFVWASRRYSRLGDGEEPHSSVEEAVKLSTNDKIIVVVEL